MKNRFEIPPTAGLPLRWSDLLPTKNTLVSGLEKYLGIPEPLITCSGTAAFIVALTFLKKQHSRRKEVIVPAYTCPLVALAISHCGLTLVLCDLAPCHFDFDFTHLSQLASKNTLAIVPTHLGGRLANIRHARQIAEKHGAILIEDAAQALGAEVVNQADITFFSLAAGKGLSIYEGGILTANDPAIQKELKKTAQALLHPNPLKEGRRCLELLAYTALYHPAGLHYVYGNPRRKALKDGHLENAVGDIFSTDIPLHPVSKWRQNIGARALSRLPDFLFRIRHQAVVRCQRLSQINGIHVFEDESEGSGVWPFLMVLMPDSQSRDQVIAQLWNSPLGVTRLFIHVLSDYTYLASIVPQTEIQHARDFAERLLTITNSPWLDEQNFEYICRILESAVSHRYTQTQPSEKAR